MIIYLGTCTKRATDLAIPDIPYDKRDCEIRGDIDLISPLVVLRGVLDGEKVEIWNYNYVYIPSWHRFYFIDDISFEGNLHYLRLSEDYLSSWYATICKQAFYCLRSVTDVNDDLTDSFFPASNVSHVRNHTVSGPWKGVMEGSYVLSIASGGNDTPHIGSNSYYIMDQSQMTDFMDSLMGSANFSFSGISNSIAKSMVDPMQYIRSCIWLPFDLTGHKKSVDTISFSWWAASASATVLDIQEDADTYTQLEVTFSNVAGIFPDGENPQYCNYPPYSSLTLWAPPFGKIEIPRELLSQFLRGYEIIASIRIDNLTGEGCLRLKDSLNVVYYVTTAQVGVDIPVGDVVQDVVGSAISAGSALKEAVSGSLLTSAASVVSAIDAGTPNVTTTGCESGFAGLYPDIAWQLTRVYYNVDRDITLTGAPCMADKRPADLSGFAKFYQPDVTGEMLGAEKTAINALLEGGVFCG